MALARRGTRIIVIDGTEYRWTVAPNDEPGVAIVVQLATGPAYTNDETWARFLGALVSVLTPHTLWRVTCESDCDQHPLKKLALSAESLSRLLDSYRTVGSGPIALQATSP